MDEGLGKSNEGIDCPFAKVEYIYPSQEISDMEYEAQMAEDQGVNLCPVMNCCECGGEYKSCSNPGHFFRMTNFFIDHCDKVTHELVMESYSERREIQYVVGDFGYILKRDQDTGQTVRLDSVSELLEDVVNEERRVKKVFGIARPVRKSDC